MTTHTAPLRTAQQATSDYYQNLPGVRAVRWILGASERLSPRLATRWAYRLFGTPMPLRRKKRSADWEAAWRIEHWPFGDAEITLYRLAGANADAPRVLLLHGWGGYARQMLPLAQTLAAQGLAPVLIEMPAHGRSRGRTSNLPQFSRALEYIGERLRSENGQPLAALIAHSLAANAAAHAVSRGLATERLVLLAPPASPREYLHLFAQAFGLSDSTRMAVQHRIEAREGVLMGQFEPPAVGPRIRPSTLVVHDRGDSINRFADGEAYRDAIAGARLIATEGLGHRKILQAPEVLRAVAGFIGPGSD